MNNSGAHIITSDHLDVGGGHKIYYEQWGNIEVSPTFFLHGGPGGGFKDRHKLNFSPSKHHVVFFDQRGAGRSKPYASTKNNTTQDLIGDIEKLRTKLKLEKINLWGRSWGSALALAYAVKYPMHVKRMVIGGVYLGSRFESDFIAAGYARYTYPEAWGRFINLVPEEHRSSGASITQYYAEKMDSSDSAEAHRHANEWTLWEATTLSLRYNRKELEAAILEEDNLAIAKLETHYFLNDCFMPDDYIMSNIEKIKHIPCYVVQGRFDNCTPPETAYRLADAYGENMTLQWVNAGHKGSEPEILAAETAVANTLLG